MDQFPREILEMIFSHLPLLDLCKSHVLVCKHWRDVITRGKFMKWQKVYYKYRSGDETAAAFLGNTSQEVGMADVKTCFKHLVTYMNSSFGTSKSDCSGALKCLQSHRHYDLAVQILRENYDFLEENSFPFWGIVALICLSSSDAWSFYNLLKSLTSSKSEYTYLDVTEKLYCMLCFFLYFANEFKVSTRWHYNLFQALHWLDNSLEQASVTQGDDHQLTHEQLRIVKHVLEPNQILKVVAFAGTGKTTTMIHFTEQNPTKKFLLVMYNRSAVDDATKKFPPNVKCLTIHQLAHRHVVHRYRKRVGNISTFTLSSSRLLGDRRGFQRYQHEALVLETLNRYMASVDRDISMDHAPTKQEKADANTGGISEQLLTVNQRTILVSDACILWNVICDPYNKTFTMPFDAFLKLWQLEKPNLFKLQDVDCIIVDEAQDMSAAMLDIILNHKGSRIIVGDPHQQIYQWRYAINALDRITPTHTYYLTKSFRFGPEVGYLASSCLSFFKGVHKKSLVGSEIRDSLAREATNRHDGQICYLARTNFVLFKKVVQVIEPHMQSSSSTPPIKIAFAGGLKNMGFDLILDLCHMRKGEMNKVQMDFLKRFQNLGKFQEFVENIGDKEWAGKLAIAKWCGDLTEKRIDTIKMLTVENMAEADVVFSTAHKSKGLEWDTVALLDDFAPKLVSHVNIADDGHGEPNLLYVAVTRARRRLILNPACYYVLLFAGDRQEQIVPTDNQKLISSTCSSCRQEFPGRFGGRSASLATLPLQVMTDTGIAMVFRSGVLCSTCAGLPWYNYHEFTSYAGRWPIERRKDDANHRALQFLAGPTEAEQQEADAFYAQRYQEMQINILPAYAVQV